MVVFLSGFLRFPLELRFGDLKNLELILESYNSRMFESSNSYGRFKYIRIFLSSLLFVAMKSTQRWRIFHSFHNTFPLVDINFRVSLIWIPKSSLRKLEKLPVNFITQCLLTYGMLYFLQ